MIIASSKFPFFRELVSLNNVLKIIWLNNDEVNGKLTYNNKYYVTNLKFFEYVRIFEDQQKNMTINRINKGTREHRYFNIENHGCESKKSCVIHTNEIVLL